DTQTESNQPKSLGIWFIWLLFHKFPLPPRNFALSDASPASRTLIVRRHGTKLAQRRPPVSWQKDGVDGGPSSVDVILKWITTEGNLQRWCGDTVGGNTKKACITGRTYKGVLQKINDIQDSYNKAADLKRQSVEGIPDEDEAKIFHDKQRLHGYLFFY
ncbi:hypothetical protein L914_20716, partial [Phytophthora nicotianae]